MHLVYKDFGVNIQTIELSGLNNDRERIELILIVDGVHHVAGKLSKPSKLLATPGLYKFFVNLDDLSVNAKRLLERHRDSEQLAEFSLNGAILRGYITRLTESFAAGAFDGVNIPQNRIMMIDLKCPARSTTTVKIPFAPETVQEMILQMLAHKRWQQVFVRSGQEATAVKFTNAESEEVERLKFDASWQSCTGGSSLSLEVLQVSGEDNQVECDRLLNEIMEPIVSNRFSPRFDEI